MTYIFRRFTFILVASSLVFSGCLGKKTQDDNWKAVYERACINRDFNTAIVALNHLIITDKEHLGEYYDSLSVYYLKRVNNIAAGLKCLDSALKLNPNSANLLELKTLALFSEGKTDEALKVSENLLKISKNQRPKYINIVVNFYKNQDMNQYLNGINQIIYGNPDSKETYEYPVDQTNYQTVPLKAQCYLDKAKIYLNDKNRNVNEAVGFIDTALIIAPDFYAAGELKNNLLKASSQAQR